MLDAIYVAFIIVAISGLYSGIFRYIVYEIGGMSKVMEANKKMQQEMREINKKYLDAAKSRKDHELKHYEEKMNKMATDLMKSQLKPMLISIPLLFVSTFIVGWLRGMFGDFTILLPIALPIPQLSLENFINWRNVFGPVGWFWITFMIFSFVAQFKIGGGKNAKTEGQDKKKNV